VWIDLPNIPGEVISPQPGGTSYGAHGAQPRHRSLSPPPAISRFEHADGSLATTASESPRGTQGQNQMPKENQPATRPTLRRIRVLPLALSILVMAPSEGAAQDGSRRALSEGSAVVRTDDSEYTITILCNDPSRPDLGFTTEANRITRAATGRRNMVTLRVRPWKDTDDMNVTLEGGTAWTAWIPQPSSAGGVLTMDVVLRPVSFVRDNMPGLLTYEMWQSGDVPERERRVQFEANCSVRDPEAPAFRKVPGPGGPTP